MNEGKGARTTVVMATILLAGTFIWRLMPSDEVPSTGLNALSILLELGMLIGVIAMVPRILRSLPEGEPRGGWIFLLVVAVISGLGIFAIRLAGGPRVELPPRTSSTSVAREGLPKQFQELLLSEEKLNEKWVSSRWLRIFGTHDPAKLRTLTRQDLQEERELCREMKEGLERIRNLFAEAKSKGIAYSTLSKIPSETRPETFTAAYDLFSSMSDYLKLIDQHWDEWLANPVPAPDAVLMPWQREVQRLTEVAAVAARQFHALLEGAVPASLAGTEAATLPKQLQEIIERWGPLIEKVQASRWVSLKANPATASTRTRQDVQAIRDIYTQLHECAEGALKIIVEAQAKGIDLTAFHEEKALGRAEFWRTNLELNEATAAYFEQIDQHWDEWKAQPEALDEKTMKPWQREMKRLAAVMAEAAQRMKETAAAPSSPLDASTPAASRAPSPAAAEVTALTKELRDLIELWQASIQKSVASRWGNIDPKDPARKRTLTRRDFEEARERQREQIEYQDRILKVLAQAKSQGIDVSAANKDARLVAPKYWRWMQEDDIIRLKQRELIDQHWAEWLRAPAAVNAKSKPWQREIDRLEEELEATARKFTELVVTAPDAAPATTPIPQTPASRAPSPAVVEVSGLAKELRDLIAAWNASLDKSAATRWAKLDLNDPVEKKTLTRRDFDEAGEIRRERGQCQERILKLLAQAKSQRIDISAATTETLLLRPEIWQIFQESDALDLKYRKLIDQHWEEWLVSSGTVDEKSKPWQREMKRLDDEMEARRKQVAALVESTSIVAAPPVKPTPVPGGPSPSPTEAKDLKTFEQFVHSLNRSTPAASPPASTPAPQAPPSGPTADFDKMALQLSLLPAVGDYVIALKRVQATRWIKSPDANSYHPQKITKADLHDANEKLRELIATVDKLRVDLDAQTMSVPAAEKEFWRIKHEVSVAFQQLTGILEENWKEWHVTGIQPKTGEPKPWQKDALRLQGEIDKVKEMKISSMLL